MPKKARRRATECAILAKLQSGDVRIVDTFKLEQPKTKVVAGLVQSARHRSQLPA